MTCSSCETGTDHCHGTLVEHVHGGVECTDDACVSVVVERHSLVIECDEILGGCGCAGDLPNVDEDDSSATGTVLAQGELLRAS